MLVAAAASAGTPAGERSGTTLFPGALLVPVPLAHPEEPRVGVRKEIGTSRLKLDIGTAMDVIVVSADSGDLRIAAGVDLFTYALTTSSEGLRLQVDAVDGFFGGHVALVRRSGDDLWQFRLRLMHVSSHLVDGHYDVPTGSWRNGRTPLPFTRDFGELIAAISRPLAGVAFRLYGGCSYATLIRPAEIRRFAFLAGVEFSSASLLPPLLEVPTTSYIAAHLTVAGIPAYAGTATLEGGVKFGPMYGRGVRLYAGLIAGPEIFHQYFDLRSTVWGLGFSFDAW